MIRIIADSTCDLPKKLKEQYGIQILPLHVLLGEEEYIDGVNINPKMIYKWSDKYEATPKTSAPSIDDAINLFKPIINNGDEIVAFSISKHLSTSHNVMCIAADILEAQDKIHVIDSGNLCAAIGLLAIEASCMAKLGKSACEIEEEMIKLASKVKSSFVVDSLTYLHRGGRCSGLTAMAGGVLKLHPTINVKDGILVPGTKYRGKMSKVIQDYMKDMKKEMCENGTRKAVVAYTGDLKEISLEIKKEVIEYGIFDEVFFMEAGCVITSHCGPNTFGIFYISK